MTEKAAFVRRGLRTVSAVASVAMAIGCNGLASAAGFDPRMAIAGDGTVLACNFNSMAIKQMKEMDYPELRMKPVMTMDYPGGEITGRGGVKFAGGMSDEEYIDSLLHRFRSKGKSLPGDRERHDRHLEPILRELIESEGLKIKASATVGGTGVGPEIMGVMTTMAAGMPDRWGGTECTLPCLPDVTVRSLVAGEIDRLDGPCPSPRPWIDGAAVELRAATSRAAADDNDEDPPFPIPVPGIGETGHGLAALSATGFRAVH